MEQYRSIKEIIDAFFPDTEYYQSSGGNLRLNKCPFCGGKKAYINPDRRVNGFCCHSGKCGANYGFMSMYKVLSGNETARYPDVVAFLDNKLPELKPYEQTMAKADEVERAPLANRHKVYSRLLELLTLDEDDRVSLRNRGLTDEQIDMLGYKSCPNRECIPEIINTLEEEGLELKGIPGFYKSYGKYTMMLATGFFIPYRSAKGYIQGMQIRRKGDENVIVEKEVNFSDTIDYTIRVKNNNSFPIFLRILDEIPKDAVIVAEKTSSGYEVEKSGIIRWEHRFQKEEERIFILSLDTDELKQTKVRVVVQPRYIWFSSGNKNGGTPATNYTHFIGKLHDVMYLTEGALKADVTYWLSNGDKSFIAVPGVSSIKNMPQIFSFFKKHGVQELRIVFDMDRIYNDHVMDAIEKAKQMAIDAGLHCTVPTWDINMGKGIDDFTLQFLKKKNKI